MKIKIFFAAALFFLHFLGMQALVLVDQSFHCGDSSSASYECCEVNATLEKQFLFSPLLVGMFPPTFPQCFFSALLFQKSIGKIIFFDLPPPEVLIWKNTIVMRC